MSAPIAGLVDYGVGNIHSITKALERVGFEVRPLAAPRDAAVTDCIVLPGVGAFAPAAAAVEPLRRCILDAVDDGTALFGVCLGLQLMYDGSAEGEGAGLRLFGGGVFELDHPRIPHIGWTTLDVGDDPFVAGLEGQHVYYVHSYAPAPDGAEVIATSAYGPAFAAVARRDRIVGTQFHPEKSSTVGLEMLGRLKRLVEDRL